MANWRTWGLSARFSLLVVGALVLASSIYIPWCIERQESFSENKALAEARTLNQEMLAAWDYVDAIQHQINYDATGRYDFKDVYCAIAGKAIAERFMRESDYTVRYVRENPRSSTDEPDPFEQEALAAFEEGRGEEYYALVDSENGKVFRYAAELRYNNSCLSCHGEPAGEPDETGFLREGAAWKDLAGAASITIPMEIYEGEIRQNTVTDILFFLLLVLVVTSILRLGVSLWVVKPLRHIGSVASCYGKGQWDASCTQEGAPKEIEALAVDLGAMAEQLRESYSSLESQVEQRTRELTQANARLKDEVRYKSDFLSIISHELKSPIVSIRASIEIWNRQQLAKAQTETNADAAWGEEQRRLAENMLLQCSHLLDTVDNALQAFRIEQGRFVATVEPLDIVDVINAARDTVEPQAKSKGVAIVCRIDPDVPIVESDWGSLEKIISNLAGNAVKFTESGGTVTLAAACRDRLTMTVSVSDTGIGIDPADHERIFERFVQLDTSLSREYHGSGLGLSLAADLAQRIHGSLSVESSLGSGSTFALTIPIKWPDEGKGGKQPGQPDALSDGEDDL